MCQALIELLGKISKQFPIAPQVNKALTELEESAFTEAELLGYDKFWDNIRVERTIMNSAKRKYDEGWEKGIAEGKAQGEHDKQQEIARSMKRDGLPAGTIARYTGLAAEDIEKLVTEDD